LAVLPPIRQRHNATGPAETKPRITTGKRFTSCQSDPPSRPVTNVPCRIAYQLNSDASPVTAQETKNPCFKFGVPLAR
jgi:hypothetical protein